jgi:DNA damage-inducible protein 1
MHITCATIEGEVARLEVSASTTFKTLKRMAAQALGLDPRVPLDLLFHGDDTIPDAATLKEAGVSEDDMIAVQQRAAEASQPPSAGSVRHSLSKMVSRSDIYQQQLIEREIVLQNIQDNMLTALEESPEVFATVLMLYINTKVNGTLVEAFVDSGAQTTVMSRKCAERCGIMRLVDPRFAGVAVGVGQAKIVGRVHLAPIVIGKQTYNCSFTVLDGEAGNMDLLLGLDMLRKLKMMIDLRNDCLHVGDEKIPFLGEAEVPAHARLH